MSEADSNSVRHCRVLSDLQCSGLADVGAELLSKFSYIVSEDGRLMACAGNSYISEACVEQLWVDARVRMNEDALSGESLGAVARDGITVVKVAVLGGVKFDPTVILEPGYDPATRRNGFDYGKVTIGNLD